MKMLIRTESLAARLMMTVGVMLSAGSLAGCGTSDVVSVDTLADSPIASSSVDAPAGDDLSGSTDDAEAFVNCLVKEGVNASLVDGQIVFDGDIMMTVDESSDGEMILKFEVNGEDVSEQYNSCEEQVPGFDMMDSSVSEEDEALMQESAQRWVECARENGFSTFEDPDSGTVMIPSDLTAEEATLLVKDCPLSEDDFFGFAMSGEQFDQDVPRILTESAHYSTADDSVPGES